MGPVLAVVAGASEIILARRQAKVHRSADGGRKGTPRYQQVAQELRTRVLQAGEEAVRLPTEHELCKIHGVSRITIGRAMDILVREGLIERAPRRGTLTVPATIVQRKQIGQHRSIQVLASQEALTVPDSFYGRVCRSICDRCSQVGYQASMQEIRAPHIGTAKYLPPPEKDRTLGTIFVGLANEPMIRLYTHAGLPVVCVDYWTTNPQSDAVVIDCYSEGQTAVDFLIRQGHSRLFFVGLQFSWRGTPERDSDSELLLAGIQRGLLLAGLPEMPLERIRFSGSRDDNAGKAAEWFLSLRPRPTAGVVFDNGLCASLIQLLRLRGILCPEHISLISKAPEGEASGITCLCGSVQAMGAEAVDILLARATGRRSYVVKLAVPSVLRIGRTVRQLR